MVTGLQVVGCIVAATLILYLVDVWMEELYGDKGDDHEKTDF